MSFSEEQTKALSAKLRAKHVRTRDQRGKRLAYLEGWYVIAEANRIFGFEAWDRETVATQCVWKGTKQGREGCAYIGGFGSGCGLAIPLFAVRATDLATVGPCFPAKRTRVR